MIPSRADTEDGLVLKTIPRHLSPFNAHEVVELARTRFRRVPSVRPATFPYLTLTETSELLFALLYRVIRIRRLLRSSSCVINRIAPFHLRSS